MSNGKLTMDITCDVCSFPLKVSTVIPRENFAFSVKVHNRCRCFSEAVELASKESVDNILEAVRNMAHGKGGAKKNAT